MSDLKQTDPVNLLNVFKAFIKHANDVQHGSCNGKCAECPCQSSDKKLSDTDKPGQKDDSHA